MKLNGLIDMETLKSNYLVFVCEDDEVEITGYDTLEEAKEDMLFILGDRMSAETMHWECDDSEGEIKFLPTADEIDEWNKMIENFTVYIMKKGAMPHTKFFDRKTLEGIGWVKK